MKTGTRLLVPGTVLSLVLLLLAQILNVDADPTSAPITASSQPNDLLVPEWWERIRDSFTGINLRMCMMRQSVPPLNGENCGVSQKTCFFGSKACPSVGVSPESQCFCDGVAGNQFWTCVDEPCPSEVTTSVPVTAAPTAPAHINTSNPSARPLGSISGSVREDLDNDGSGDVEISNVAITLLDERNIVVGTTLTDASGNYVFTDVPTGNYVVVQTNSGSDESDGVTAPVATSAAPVSIAPIGSPATAAPASIAPIEGSIAPTTLSPATVAPATEAPATEAPVISTPTARSESSSASSAPATRSPVALTMSPVAIGSLATPVPATEAPNTATLAATTPVAMSAVPVWWDRISSTFDGINLKMCLGRQSDPPFSGDACSAIPKTCFFGNKQCPEPSPVLQCYCDGAAGDQIWRCDVEPCPSDATSNPVATTASPATLAPIALTEAPASSAPTTGAPIVGTVAQVTIAPSTAVQTAQTDGPGTTSPITVAPATNEPVTSLVDTSAPTYIVASTEPLWWERISATFVGVHLRMCEKRMMRPPVDGEVCSIAPKTCFFGTKDCPEIGASPVKRCFCPGQNAGQVWQCTDEACPASAGENTSQPSGSLIAAPVTGSLETTAPMSVSPVLFSKDDVTTDQPSVSPVSTPVASQSNPPPTNAPSLKPTRSPIRASSPPTKINEADGSLPEWWQLISSMPGVVNLGRCEKRSKPPSDGLACGLARKTCFFGTKQCVEVGAFPTTRCFCDGNSGEQIWRCEDETCPDEITDAPTGIPSDSPSSAPTIAVVGSFAPSFAPSSKISESASEDRTAAPSDSPASAVVAESESPTEAPLTEAPVQPSKAPTVPAEAPVQPTKAPVQPTEPTAATVLSTGAPGLTTEVDVPTTFPTAESGTPGDVPSSEGPTSDPTYNPTEFPTGFPTSAPTSQPGTPMTDPTDVPTNPTAESETPSGALSSEVPTPDPTYNPTELPTGFPTSAPTSQPGTPTTDPTDKPTNPTAESGTPSGALSSEVPTPDPTYNPTELPTGFPTSAPTSQPTYNPTDVPPNFQTSAPTSQTGTPTADSADAPTNTPIDIPVGATVRGNVTEDVNNDGTGDAPISNVVVTLCDRNKPSDCVSTTTDSDGLFRFDNVSSPAEYCVIETNLGNYIDVSDAIGDNINEMDSGIGIGLSNIVCLVLNAGDVGVPDIEFVDRLPSTE